MPLTDATVTTDRRPAGAVGSAQRWSGLVVPTVLALMFYLITPDRLPGQPTGPAPAAAAAAGLSQPAGHPSLTSDGVTTVARAATTPDRTDTALPIFAAPEPVTAHVVRWRLLRAPPVGEPDLHLLRILRC